MGRFWVLGLPVLVRFLAGPRWRLAPLTDSGNGLAFGATTCGDGVPRRVKRGLRLQAYLARRKETERARFWQTCVNAIAFR
ncbi:hypothetical protein MPNT_40069 [Candidatus Methylacidithermus pantelleriae]|uniref:Uncharacterized protein n=1 Tax=Candidatus Methylacidithermus pantelleriae TaxID=2744239 RepID=A0A8J2BUY7_9BACT|nr:hypothetical protein MPNT_40069 [Candidatus Methylacidithermus pantelleriae]